MANTSQSTEATKEKPSAEKSPGAGKRKPAQAKRAGAKSRASRSRSGAATQSLFERGKKVLGDAYEQAGSAGSALPHSLRNVTLPSQRSLQALVEEKPLILGAVGIGVGMILGAILPSIGGPAHSGNGSARRRRA